MKDKFKEKRVLVTGSSRGIGRSVVEAFVQRGATVYANYFVSEYEPAAKENMENMLDSLGAMSEMVISACFDVSDEEEVKNFFNTLTENLDIIVNNAGVVRDNPLSEKDFGQFQWTMNTNAGGVFLLSKNSMNCINNGGSIVNISSTNSMDCFFPESIEYDASKSAINIMTRNFAKELDGKVRVNVVSPGWVDAEMNTQLPDDFKKEEEGQIYLKRFARPVEIANVVLFLSSEDASFVNGANIVVDSGHG